MMNNFIVSKFPAFREDSSAVELKDILTILPENRLVWSIMEFDGIGCMPNQLSVDEFSDLVRVGPYGYLVSWEDLKLFSRSLRQTVDCLIVGARGLGDISSFFSSRNNLSYLEVYISAFDSTTWSVWAKDVNLMREINNNIKKK